MKFIELVQKRYSVRNFSNEAISEEQLSAILEAVRLAPSAVNFQPYRFCVVSNKNTLAQLAQCYSREWFAKAPLCIVACGDHTQGWHRADGKDHTDIDVAIAVDHLTLAAAEQGIGTCWVCNFDVKRCAEILNLPNNLEPIALIPMGYAANVTCDERHKTRKSANDLFTFIR